MSKTACVSCSTTARESAAALAIAPALLVHDAGVTTAVAKCAALALIAVVLLAWGGARKLTLPILLWMTACGWLACTLGWSDTAIPLALMPMLTAFALSIAFTRWSHRELTVARMAMLIGASSSAVAVWQRAHGDVAHGFQGNPDWLGLVLVAALPFMWPRIRAARGVERWVAMAAVALTLVGLALSHSRSAWIGGAAAAVWLARGRWRVLCVALSFTGLAAAVFMTDFHDAWQGRTWIWRHAFVAGLDAPALGAGVGRFAFPFLDAQGVSLRALPLDVAAVRFVNATTGHNDALHLFVEGGVVAPLLVGAALAAAAWQLRVQWPAATAGLIAIAVSGLGDVPLQQPGVLVFVACALAACPRIARRRVDRYVGMVALGVAVLVLPSVTQQWIAERRVERAKHQPPFDAIHELTAAAEGALDPGVAALELGQLWLAVGKPGNALPWLTASQQTLANVGTDIVLSTTYLQLDNTDSAIIALQRALARHPARFAAHANLVEAARRAGRLDLAARHLAAAKELQPHHPKLRHIEEELRRTVIEHDAL